MRSDAAVLLASRQFASWLEDESFMSSFVGNLTPNGVTDLTMVMAVVDGLPPEKPFGPPQSGFSILQGALQNIMPDVWKNSPSHPEMVSGRDTGASISFQMNSLGLPSSPSLKESPGTTPSLLEVTLPLANTVFQNGRRSTLLASRWEKNGHNTFKLKRSETRDSQLINCTYALAEPASVSHIPLLPLTPPRRIVSGLGNIIRQIEIDEGTIPASKELESIIPKIFKTRNDFLQREAPSLVQVWALVIPRSVTDRIGESDLGQPNPLPYELETINTEQKDAWLNSGEITKWLKRGCHLHKIRRYFLA
jgi:hypothetical protein